MSEVLQKSWMETILNNSRISTYIKNKESRFIFINKKFQQVTGFSQSYVQGKSSRELFGEKRGGEFIRHDQEVMKGGAPLEFHETVVINGVKTTFLSVKMPLRSETGVIEGVCGISSDITSLKRKEEEMERQKERLDNVINSLPAIVWELKGVPTFSGIEVTFVNTGITAMTGYTQTELLNGVVELSELFEPLEWAKFIKDRKEILSSGLPKTCVYKMIRKDGEAIWVKNYPMIIKDTAGKPLGLRSIIIDISNEVVNDLKLRRSIEASVLGVCVWDGDNIITQPNKMLLKMLGRHHSEKISLPNIFQKDSVEKFKEVNQFIQKKGSFKPFEAVMVTSRERKVPVFVSGISISLDKKNIMLFINDISERKDVERKKSEFISVASHELKTPVTSMKVYTELLRKSLPDSSESKVYVKKINDQVDRLTELVRELLDMSRIEANKMVLQKDLLNLNGTVFKISCDLEETFKNHKLYLHEEAQVTVRADQLRLTQVLINMFTNAVKYSPRSSRVEVYIKDDKEMVYVGVQDHGIGISKSSQKKLFEPFYRVSGDLERTYPGLGVGLYVSRVIIQGHGGTMWVESKKGRGSTFWFSLPKEVIL